jgi:hypothetical protein
MGYIGAWYPTAAALRATSVPMPHTWAAVAVLGLIFATRPALDRAFRWLALRRDVG